MIPDEEKHTVEQVRNAKRELELDIKSQLNAFAREYGVHVEFINLEHLESVTQARGHERIVESVSVTASL